MTRITTQAEQEIEAQIMSEYNKAVCHGKSPNHYNPQSKAFNTPGYYEVLDLAFFDGCIDIVEEGGRYFIDWDVASAFVTHKILDAWAASAAPVAPCGHTEFKAGCPECMARVEELWAASATATGKCQQCGKRPRLAAPSVVCRECFIHNQHITCDRRLLVGGPSCPICREDAGLNWNETMYCVEPGGWGIIHGLPVDDHSSDYYTVCRLTPDYCRVFNTYDRSCYLGGAINNLKIAQRRG